jgi:competence protein ComEA
MATTLASWREALTRQASRFAGSRFAKPAARVAGGIAGLLLLAIVGRTAAGAMGSASSSLVSLAPSSTMPSVTVTSIPAAPIASWPAPTPSAPPTGSSTPPSPSPARYPASADDPVTLNTASFEDLRRLPGIGDKRANAILALRAQLGRFRALEDLLKVKGIGRAMLKRLRPLVRLDPAGPADAGSAKHP